MKLALRLCSLAVVALAVCAWAQTTNTTGTGTSTSTTNTPGSTPGTNTPPPPVSPTPGGSATRDIFLSGKVMTDDGSPLPGSVNIVSICGTLRRTMDHTTVTGTFAFQWTNTSHSFGDASEATRSTGGNGGASLTGSRSGSRGLDPLANCDLLAESPGYKSSTVSLYDRAGQNNYDVGVIVLHRLTGSEGHTISMLALKAPKAAKKSFEKGTSLAAANKSAEAAASFETAVRIYPQYADAWLGLGKTQWDLGQKEEARGSFQKSMALDDHLVGPWEELGFLACDDSKWEDAIRYLDQAVRLDPMDSPAAWYFNAVANYNLGHFDLAERSVRAALKLDSRGNPQADYLLALVLIARKDLAGGAEALRIFIASSPKTPNAESAKRELSHLETQLGTSHYAERQ